MSISIQQSGREISVTITPQAAHQIEIKKQGTQGVKGDKGDIGPANTLDIGTVTKGDDANATITGSAPNQTLNLVLPKGDKGDTGEAGPTGPQGEVGPQGIQGETGPQGPQGEIGPTGSNGPAGPKGDQGNVGPKGDQGDVGPKGPKGDKGDTGNVGPQGDTGPQGHAGIDGQDGASAYELAAANGFVGTEAEWLASLVGPEGPQGDQGPAGPAGDGAGDMLASVYDPQAIAGDAFDRSKHTGTQPASTVSGLATVATSGSYGDLSGTPSLGGAAALNVGTAAGTVAAGNDSRIINATPTSRTISAGTGLTGGGTLASNRSFALSAASIASLAKADTAVQPGALATVATSGSYNDLSGKPTIPAAQVNSDWNAASGIAQILNKPTLFSGAYGDLTGKPTLGTAAAQDSTAFATAAQGAKADSALQPAAIGSTVQGYSAVLAGTTASFTTALNTKLSGIAAGAEVNVNADWNAGTGDAQILNKPTLGTAAAANTGDFATAAQGAFASTAVQPARSISAGTGLAGGGDLAEDRSLAIDKATVANVRAAASNKVLTTDLINSASAPVALTDAATIAVDWNSFVTSNLVVTANRTMGNPTNVQTGTSRIIRIVGDNATERSLAFATNYKAPLPEETVTSTKGLLLSLYAHSSTEIHVTWKAFEL